VNGTGRDMPIWLWLGRSLCGSSPQRNIQLTVTQWKFGPSYEVTRMLCISPRMVTHFVYFLITHFRAYVLM